MTWSKLASECLEVASFVTLYWLVVQLADCLSCFSLLSSTLTFYWTLKWVELSSTSAVVLCWDGLSWTHAKPMQNPCKTHAITSWLCHCLALSLRWVILKKSYDIFSNTPPASPRQFLPYSSAIINNHKLKS